MDTTCEEKQQETGANAAFWDGIDKNASVATEETQSLGEMDPSGGNAGSGFRLLAKTTSSIDPRAVIHSDDTGRAIRDVSNQYSNKERRKSEAGLSKVLLKQMRSLAEAEKGVLEREEHRRLEHLVQKVEDEVECEGILDDMCTRVRAEDEAMEMERREREWELERREVRLEEEVDALKGKIRKLEDQLRISQAEKNFLIQRKQDEVEDVIQRLLQELKDEETSRSIPKDMNLEEQIRALFSATEDDGVEYPNQEIFAAFEDMFREADERHEREKQELANIIRAKDEAEEALRQDRQKLRVREKQMECRVMALEKESARFSSLVREKDGSIVAEKERRKAIQEEADRLSNMLKEERLAHKVAVAKLKKLEIGFHKLKEKISREHGEVYRDLEKEVGRLSLIFSQKKEPPKTEAQHLEALKKQREAAVSDRERLEEKLDLLLRRARDREAEIDAMWLEREKLLIEKLAALEEQAEKWEIKCRRIESEFLHERRIWQQKAQDASTQHEVRALENIIREAEVQHKEEEERLRTLLEAKDRELQALTTMQRKLLNALAHSKTQVEEMKSFVHEQSERDGSSRQPQDVNGPEESEAESCIDVEGVAAEMEMELARLSKDMKCKEQVLEKERCELKGEAERLRVERIQLERKVFDTLSLMEELKEELAGKESQMEREKQHWEDALTSKAAEIETLREKLEFKGVDTDAQVERFRSEMRLIQQDLENERRERKKLMDLHFASSKKLSVEVRLKEEIWEKDMERTMQELISLRTELRKKNEDLESLRKENLEMELELSESRKSLATAEHDLKAEISRLKQENAERKLGDGDERVVEAGSGSLRESIEDKRNAEWQFALAKVAVFDKQITEAMSAIQNLREELSVKEAELLKAKADPEAEWERREEEWIEQRKRQEAAWHKREEELIAEKTELLKRLEAERSEAADAIASFRGTIRELRWSLMQNEDSGSCEIKSSHAEGDNRELVKIHANHFKDVDQYICGLKSKMRELERKLALSKVSKEGEALSQVERTAYSPSLKRLTSIGAETSTNRSFFNSQQEDAFWNFGGGLSCLQKFSTGNTEEILAHPVHNQRQKKWIVDSTWIDQVRKEYFILTQQLMIERQRRLPADSSRDARPTVQRS